MLYLEENLEEKYDIQHGWVFIANFLKYNSIENPNQGKSISKLFSELQHKLIFFQQLADKLLEHSEYFQEDFQCNRQMFMIVFN